MPKSKKRVQKEREAEVQVVKNPLKTKTDELKKPYFKKFLLEFKDNLLTCQLFD